MVEIRVVVPNAAGGHGLLVAGLVPDTSVW
jgi:hypothetical protein